jgi:predicted RNA-binding protein
VTDLTKDGAYYEVDIDFRIVIMSKNPVQAQVDALELLRVAAETGHLRDYIQNISACPHV